MEYSRLYKHIPNNWEGGMRISHWDFVDYLLKSVFPDTYNTDGRIYNILNYLDGADDAKTDLTQYIHNDLSKTIS